MCGILGLLDPSGAPVAADLYRGALALQHRGQEGAGIVTWDRRFFLESGRGLLSDVFGRVDLGQLRGSIGMAHLRYGTAGTGAQGENQPFLLSFPFGLALVHNGNLTNTDSLRAELESGSWHLNSASDSEALLQILADRLAQSDLRRLAPADVFRAVARTMDVIEGAYSVIVILAHHGLLAFRDPRGIRPLALGRRGPAWAVASESVALDTLDFALWRDVRPGEAVFLDDTGRLHEAQLRTARSAHCAFEYVYMARPESVLDGHNVSDVRERLGRSLSGSFDRPVDLVCDVPSSAEDVAMAFAATSSLPYRKAVRKNHYSQRSFLAPTQTARLGALGFKFHLAGGVIAGKRLALVDDSVVRGNTARALVGRLRRAGAKEVHLLSAAPPIRHPCVYGIDMAIPGELLAVRVNSLAGLPAGGSSELSSAQTGALAGDLDADSLTYQTCANLEASVPDRSLCTACFSGRYPTEVSDSRLAALGAARAEAQRLADPPAGAALGLDRPFVAAAR